MACLLVPAAEAVISTVITKVVKSKEKDDKASVSLSHDSMDGAAKIKFSTKLGWLNKMLWGGSVLLAFEHLWHGEIIPTFPFLTAVESGETAGMLAEMGSVGVTMALLVTVVWGGMVAVSTFIEKKASVSSESKEEVA